MIKVYRDYIKDSVFEDAKWMPKKLIRNEVSVYNLDHWNRLAVIMQYSLVHAVMETEILEQ